MNKKRMCVVLKVLSSHIKHGIMSCFHNMTSQFRSWPKRIKFVVLKLWCCFQTQCFKTPVGWLLIILTTISFEQVCRHVEWGCFTEINFFRQCKSNQYQISFYLQYWILRLIDTHFEMFIDLLFSEDKHLEILRP